jgi:hypothetical protein
MIVSNHILQIKGTSKLDADGYAIPGSDYTDYCKCRCDDNSNKEFKSEDGHVYTPAFHIIYEGAKSLPEGTEIRILYSERTVKGEGTVYRKKEFTMFNYVELWM